jgi:hypothetical protein
MVSTYIFYLPKYTTPAPVFSVFSSVGHIQKDNSGSSVLPLHFSLKSITENNHKKINRLIKIAALAFLLIFGAVSIPGCAKRLKEFSRVFYYPHQNSFLSLCILRI